MTADATADAVERLYRAAEALSDYMTIGAGGITPVGLTVDPGGLRVCLSLGATEAIVDLLKRL